ncbi:LLM class flavin-dependent oxidoreductase [Curtobacterium sp. MCBD17_034]|nr:LLM class flavin-dependent oxidoreductase [Curtobacterium sp. MCBD17_034]PZM35151.1 LLM class flavin-dependent oxidoreductase [Curtobacterium sp. MCBD17_031]
MLPHPAWGGRPPASRASSTGVWSGRTDRAHFHANATNGRVRLGSVLRELGFLSFVPNHGGPAGAAAALEDGLQLFEHAEGLGYATGWVRGRHFEPFLTSPMTFFAAAAQRTRRIGFGTAVLGMRYEDPIRLAEDVATVDLLSGGRVELGISTGIPQSGPVLDPLFGTVDRPFREEAEARAARLLEALRGDALGTSGGGYESIPAGKDLVVEPRSAGVLDRVWWGGGSTGTAVRTAERGLDLHLSTLNTEDTGAPFADAQAAQIVAYRERLAEAHPGRTGRVAIGRIVVPFETDADAATHREFIESYAAGMDDEGRPRSGTPPFRFSKVLAGEPERIVEALLGDPAVAATDQLVITLPANGGAASHRRILSLVADRIAPHLGWTPAA